MLKHLTLAFAFLLPVAVLAQETEGDFSTLDANADGSISQEEAQADEMVAQNFEAADADQNGSLSQEEYDAAFSG
jgi:Ca2+-binding EF-hand superfamily protein